MPFTAPDDSKHFPGLAKPTQEGAKVDELETKKKNVDTFDFEFDDEDSGMELIVETAMKTIPPVTSSEDSLYCIKSPQCKNSSARGKGRRGRAGSSRERDTAESDGSVPPAAATSSPESVVSLPMNITPLASVVPAWQQGIVKEDLASPESKTDLDSSYGEAELVINLEDQETPTDGEERSKNQFQLGSDSEEKSPAHMASASTSPYKNQRPSRTRKPTNYKAMEQGLTITSPRASRSGSSPRAVRGGQSPKHPPTPRGRGSPKASNDMGSPVVKLLVVQPASDHLPPPVANLKELVQEEQASDDSTSSMRNVEKIIDAVSKGFFDKSDHKPEVEKVPAPARVTGRGRGSKQTQQAQVVMDTAESAIAMPSAIEAGLADRGVELAMLGPQPSTVAMTATTTSRKGIPRKRVNPLHSDAGDGSPVLKKAKLSASQTSVSPGSGKNTAEQSADDAQLPAEDEEALPGEEKANVEAIMAAGNMDTKGKKRPAAEYTCGTTTKDDKKVPHTCCSQCVKYTEMNLEKHAGKNVLQFPLLCNWERKICNRKRRGRKCVVYRAPCGRQLKTIKELDDFLLMTDSQLGVDSFCFDTKLNEHTEFVPVKSFGDIKDISYGKENIEVPCTNDVDCQYPELFEYSPVRIPGKGVNILLDEEFLQCCDCTDNCKDRAKCSCQQLTVENTTCIGERNSNAGYHHRRLKEMIVTGVVECNSRCKCDNRCRNRVAQNGLSCRLQVFKTEKCGWGVRCLNDIPKGGFICTYVGQVLTDMEADDVGKKYGDEYLADLDFIEGVERQKEGYESNVADHNDINGNAEEEEENFQSDNGDEANSSDRTTEEMKGSDQTGGSRERGEEEDSYDRRVEAMKTDELLDLDKPEPSPKAADLKDIKDDSTKKEAEEEERKTKQRTRSLLKDTSSCYIVDGKIKGNVGRFLNHSCSPNVFVQNVFVDTHDLRFPWLAFFAAQYIRAGTELTWDYNYEVGSVPNKVLYCHCNTPVCRGRLL